ncbi:MAG: hypothetical protein FJ271_31015 [Planctomycetes bacterium]|nr:hypothetical protein [Planctomycetota bacterium]
MTRSRDWALVAALALLLAVTGRVWPDGRKQTAASKDKQQVKVYALGELATRAGDPAIGDWLAKTVPQMIAPGSWSPDGGAGTLSYYAQGKLLVVSNEPAVQNQVRAFLDGLKKELPRGKSVSAKEKPAAGKAMIIPVRLSAPDQDPTLPVPDPAFQPQFMNEPARHYGHLVLEGLAVKENEFKLKKFSIMYRGEGLIDDTLAKLIKSLNKPSSSPAPATVPGQPATPLEPGAKPVSPGPVDGPASMPEDDEPAIGSRTSNSEKPAKIPAPKKARRPASTAKPTKSTFVQSRYAPAPRLAPPPAPPMVQVVVPEDARHYAHLVVEGLSYSEQAMGLKKLSIVYRGDGIIDSNVAKVIKAMGVVPGVHVEQAIVPEARGPLELSPSGKTPKGVHVQ